MEFVFAYFDPGSASMIFQAFIGALLVIPFFFRAQIGKGVRAVRRAVGRETASSGHDG